LVLLAGISLTNHFLLLIPSQSRLQGAPGKMRASSLLARGEETTNRLTSQKSPYLLNHAHDLVNWYPWGPAAFERARKENKLIFLSIGYSSCHWCHVMQRENFEDPGVAKLMNRAFVVKINRLFRF